MRWISLQARTRSLRYDQLVSVLAIKLLSSKVCVSPLRLMSPSCCPSGHAIWLSVLCSPGPGSCGLTRPSIECLSDIVWQNQLDEFSGTCAHRVKLLVHRSSIILHHNGACRQQPQDLQLFFASHGIIVFLALLPCRTSKTAVMVRNSLAWCS